MGLVHWSGEGVISRGGWAVDTQRERRNSRQWERESCKMAATGAGWEGGQVHGWLAYIIIIGGG